VSTLGKAVRSVSPSLHAQIAALVNGNFEVFPPRRIAASKPLHRRLKALFAPSPGFFIEAGANNGVTASNTYYLEKHCGWTGLLIEAIPHRFVECRKARPKSLSIHCGLVSPEYSKEYVELVYMDRMTMMKSNGGALNVGTQMAKAVATTRHQDGLIGTTFLAPARTLASVLAERGNPAVDFFSLDVEGHELDVLKGLDFNICSPRRILVEDWDKSGVGAFLAEKGYRVEERFGDRDAMYALG
jgi:FkbM family methyltransferase